MEATDVSPANPAGMAPFVPRRLPTPELWRLRWSIFASRWPSLRDAIALAARACAACALVLAAARAGAFLAAEDEDWRGGIRRRRGWKHAEVSVDVYRGAAALVVPFVLLSALAVVRESLVRAAREAALRRAPRFDASVVFLADARDAATRAAARARDDAEARQRDAYARNRSRRQTTSRGDIRDAPHAAFETAWLDISGALLDVFATSRESASSISREASVSDGADAEPVIRHALETMSRATRRSGGEQAARWLAALRHEDALPPTTALVLVRDEAASRDPKGGGGNGRTPEPGGSSQSSWSRGADDSDASSSGDDAPNANAANGAVSSSSSESDDASSSSSSDASSETSSSDRLRDASLAVALVAHVVPGVPRSAVGPPASARGAGGWRGDERRFRERCPETVSVAVIELPKRGGAPGAYVGDAYEKSASKADVAEAVASVAETLPRRLGVHAVVLPIAEDAPMPFVASALARRGAHAVLRRPEDDPGFVLRLGAGERGGWDGVACGAHARARRDHRRRARRFAARGGVVAEASASAFACEDHLRDWSRALAWPVVSNVAAEGGGPSRPSRGGGDTRDARDASRRPGGKDDAALASASSPDGGGALAPVSPPVAFARADANAGVAAVRAALAPADASAGWRVLEARVDGERVGALLLETPPSRPGRDAGGPGTRPGTQLGTRLGTRRSRRSGSELGAGSRDRVRARACWLHPDTARARGCDAYRALLRGAVAFAAARGCVAVELGAGGAREKRRMGAVPARATAMVLFDDWTLGALADGAKREASLMHEELLRWAVSGGGGDLFSGRRGATPGDDATEDDATSGGRTTSRVAGVSPGPSRRAARRAARLERRRAARLSHVASRAFRAAVSASGERARANKPATRRRAPETISEPADDDDDDETYDDDDDDDDAWEYRSDDDSDDEEEDVLFEDAFDEAASTAAS